MATRSKPRSRKIGKRPDADFVRSILSYNRQTGVLRWKRRNDISKSNSAKHAGKRAGTRDSKGHRQIVIHDVAYMAHQLAWLIVTGQWPFYEIDHKNVKPDDNRWCNLRPATDTQNKCNEKIRKNSTTGKKGVSIRKNRPSPFVARITLHGKTYDLGRYKTREKAHAAYRKAAKKLHGNFARFA